MPPRDAPSTGRTGLTDAQIHGRLIGAVQDHRLAPGTKLVEDRLGRAFGVSRTRIRQVLIRLAQEQIVTLTPNCGATVAQPTVEEAREVFEARRLIEPVLAARVVAHGTPALMRTLAQNIRAEEAARQCGDRHAEIRLSGEFHLLLAQAARHATFERMLSELVSRTSLVLMAYGRPASPPTQRTRCNCGDHRALLAALKLRDAPAAGALMQTHLLALEAGLQFERPAAPDSDLFAIFADEVQDAG